jgi:hypothetical protein
MYYPPHHHPTAISLFVTHTHHSFPLLALCTTTYNNISLHNALSDVFAHSNLWPISIYRCILFLILPLFRYVVFNLFKVIHTFYYFYYAILVFTHLLREVVHFTVHQLHWKILHVLLMNTE